MNGFKILLLLVASTQVASTQVAWAQAEVGKERDYGWAINQADGVLEYIVQINPEKLLAMQQRSVKFPSGQETVSNMPRELVGRASRVVVRIGNEILPRVPSLEQLEREPRITDPLSAGSTAMLPPGRMQDVESGVFNIQQRETPPTLPTLPNGLDSNLSSRGNLIDEASKAAGSLLDNVKVLRGDNNNSLSDAMPAFPDPTALAQNFNNQQGGASDFLNSSRGAATGGTKFNNTAPPAGTANSTNTNSGLSTPFPPNNTTSNPLGNATTNANNNTAAGNPPNTLPSYPDPRFTPPSLNNPSTLPLQQTPSQGFGTSPGLANRPGTNWNPSPTAPLTNPSYSQVQDPYANSQYQQPNYTHAPTLGNQYPATPLNNSQYAAPSQPPSNLGYDRVAMNNNLTNSQPPTKNALRQVKRAPPTQTSLESETDALIDPSTRIDGVLQVLFLLSLVVNFYLGILIRKLLMRYRSLLTNVRQTAYT
jgi:hypothetical protein